MASGFGAFFHTPSLCGAAKVCLHFPGFHLPVQIIQVPRVKGMGAAWLCESSDNGCKVKHRTLLAKVDKSSHSDKIHDFWGLNKNHEDPKKIT